MINVIRNNDIDVTFELTDANDVAIDLTGGTLWFTVRNKIPATSIKTNDDAIISIEQTGVAITSASSGRTIFSVTNVQNDINPGTYLYDIKYKNSLGRIKTVKVDDYTVEGDIGRDR
jgi:hypothetical protein